MSITENPDAGLPALAQETVIEWSAGNGKTREETFKGTAADCLAKANDMASVGESGDNLEFLRLTQAYGRGTLVAKYGRYDVTQQDGTPSDVTIIETLYAVDVLKDISEAAYFDSLANEQVAWVKRCVENQWTESEITAQAIALAVSASLEFGNWSAGMIELHYHYTHGCETYLETGFVFRRSSYGVRTSSVLASFTGINTKVTAPTFKTAMGTLIAALPSGEWLLRAPQSEHLGKGKWRVDEEWQWAVKWSKVYGGTWGAP